MIDKILHRLSHLFGEGPLTPQDFRRAMAGYASLPLRHQIQIWARLICLQPILKAIDQYIPATSGMLTDLGCGHGLVSRLVAFRRKQPILGIEASPSRLAVAQRAAQGLQHVTFQHGDIVETPIQPSAAILLIDVLYLFPHEIQQRILTNCGHTLGHNGRLLIKDNTTCPRWKHCYANFEERLKLFVNAYGVTAPKAPNYRSPHSWRHLITQAGLKICEAFFIESLAPYPGIIYICQKSASSVDSCGNKIKNCRSPLDIPQLIL